MAAYFLRVVNSPLNRRACKVESVTQAVALLGINQIHDIVLSVSVAKAFEGLENDIMDMKKFWYRSVYCAVLTRQLALECSIPESDRCIIIGLLHDIGHLFMYLSVPQKSQEAILAARYQERPLYQVERELMGFDYAKVGRYVMKEWNLPERIQVTTWFHLEPARAKEFVVETSLLHIATLLVQADQEKGVFGSGPFAVDPAAWRITGLEEEICLRARDIAAEECTEIAETIFPMHAD